MEMKVNNENASGFSCTKGKILIGEIDKMRNYRYIKFPPRNIIQLLQFIKWPKLFFIG